MKQFILTAPAGPDGLVRLRGADYHYLARVRRLTAGAAFKALLPDGAAVLVQVRSLEDGCLTGAVLEQDAGAERPGTGGLPPLALFQAVAKNPRMDLILRQAAEGGIGEVAPFFSAYSVPQATADAGRAERWRRIVREALQQSGSPVPTRVHAPQDVAGLLAYWAEVKARYAGALGILLHHERIGVETFHGLLKPPVPDFVALAVGPEGGFSPEEVARFLAAGFKPVLMGETVLRVETAALYGAASIRIILLESASWMPASR